MMRIHVVHAGESLYSISKRYGVSVAAIALANQLNPADTLVIGQALVIPVNETYYFVQPGDSLYQIARRFGVSVERLAEINGIDPSEPLSIGFRLFIPQAEKTEIETNAYAEAQNGVIPEGVIASVAEHAPLLTYVAPFSFEARADGSLSPLDVSAVQAAVADSGAVLMMAVTNLENGRFSDTLGQEILGSEQVQDTLLDNIVNAAWGPPRGRPPSLRTPSTPPAPPGRRASGTSISISSICGLRTGKTTTPFCARPQPGSIRRACSCQRPWPPRPATSKQVRGTPPTTTRPMARWRTLW